MLKAVIFDFDGVITDSEPLHYEAINKTITKYDIQIPKEKYWDDYLGYTDIDCFAAISKDYELDLDDDELDQLVDEKFLIFEELVRKGTTVIDGVAVFVKMLKDGNVPLAICSGALAADIELMLDGTEIKGLFDVIVSADDVEKGKPDPEGYIQTLEKLNEKVCDRILPGECVVIEDSHWGLEAARSAGMKSIAVANTYPKQHLQEYADLVTDRLDLIGLNDLKKLCNN
ncbi:MAG: HAD family phosphatase [Sedimentisphaerales bacterium]|nr:HAD family phosphatase [Sedimentisphaerales bacterium]